MTHVLPISFSLNGQAIAIYIPSDTARIATECRRKVPA